jgi:PAS domain S-box-containing protein
MKALEIEGSRSQSVYGDRPRKVVTFRGVVDDMSQVILDEEIDRAERRIRALLGEERLSREELAGGLEEISSALTSLRRSVEDRKRRDDEHLAAEEALRRSMERYRALVENVDGVIYVVEPKGRIAYVSPAVERIFGYSVGEILGQNVSQFIHPEDVGLLEKRIKSALGGRSAGSELRFIDKEGGVRFVRTYGRPIDEGRLEGLHGILVDITEQKKVEEALKDSEERLKLAVEGADLAIWNWDLITDEVVGNHRYAEMIGLGPVEKSTGEQWKRSIHPDDIPAVEAAIRETLEGKRPLFDIDYRTNSGGDWIWIQDRGHVVERDGEGLPAKMAGVMQEVSWRKNMEMALAESERRFREMADTLPQPIFECDLLGRVTFANQTAFDLYGYDRDDLDEGVNIFQVFAYEDRENMMENFQRSLHEDRVFTYEYTGLKKEGSTFHLIVYSRPIIREGRPVGLRGTIVDITDRKRVEENIKQLADLSEKLVEIGSPMICVIDRRRRIFLWNRAAEEVTGYSAGEVMGDEEVWTVLFPDPLERSEFLDALEEIDLGATAESHSSKIRVSSGGEKVISWNGIKLEDSDGNGIGIVITGQDMTEYARMEEEIRSEREFSRGIIEGADLFIVGLDPQGRITLFNRGAENVTGHPSKEVMGTNFFDRFVSRTDRGTFKVSVSSLFEGKPSGQTEAAVITRTGDEMAVQWSWSVVRSRTGEIERVIAFGHDISYDRWLEEQMLLFMDAIESSNDGIAIFGKADHLLFANPALLDMFGFKLEEVRGRLYRDFILDFGEETSADDEKNGSRRRMTCVRKDGSTFPASVSFAPVTSKDGGLMATIAVARDISETIEYEEKLKNLNRELESFAYTISHDLRAPLRGIQGFSLALQEDFGSKLDETGRRYIDRIGKIAAGMDRLILDLLDHSRIGRIVSPPEDIDMKKLILEAYEEVRSLAKDKPIDLSLKGEFPVITLERSRAKQIFTNLLENSIKYSKDFVDIEVGCLDHGDGYEFSVRDRGIGFDMIYHDRIFDPFSRLDRSGEGSGIGLATVKKIIETFGGRIWAESSPGEGSVFRFTIPKERPLDDRPPQRRGYGTRDVHEDDPSASTDDRERLVDR